MLPLHTTTRGLKVKIGVTAISAKAKQNGGVYLSLSHDLTGQKSKFGAVARGGPAGEHPHPSSPPSSSPSSPSLPLLRSFPFPFSSF